MNGDFSFSTVKVTRGSYRNIGFEINHPHGIYKFTYYIYLPIDRLKDRELAERLWIKAETGCGIKYCNYLHNEFLINLSFHCRITFYRKIYADDDTRIIKIGCDYNHYRDEEQEYTLEDILSDVRVTIEDLRNKVKFNEN